MYFRILPDDGAGQVTYLLADLEAAEAVLIDPRMADLGVIQALLQEHHLRHVTVLCTDGHNRCRAQRDELMAALPQGGSHPVPVPALEGGLVPFGAEHVRVIATPGHSAHGVSYLWRDRLFCGGLLTPLDCLVHPGVDDPAAWWDSVSRKVLSLPPETLLFNGHASPGWMVSNVMTQRRSHPWFAGLGRDDAMARMTRRDGDDDAETLDRR